MIATIVNAAAILLGGTIGLVFKSKIKPRFLDLIMTAIPLAVLLIGMQGALGTQDMLGLIICLVVGALIGEAFRIEDRLNSIGTKLQQKVEKGEKKNSAFTEGFVSATLLYCVGSMAIVGSLEAGIHGNYEILFSKSLLDGVTAIAFAATLGYGMLFSAIPIIIYQGAITLLAQVAAPVLSPAVVTEMSAVGGLLIVALSINMLGFREKKIPIGNLLPAILLPILYQPFVEWLSKLF